MQRQINTFIDEKELIAFEDYLTKDYGNDKAQKEADRVICLELWDKLVKSFDDVFQEKKKEIAYYQ